MPELTRDQVVEVITLVSAGTSRREVARRFGVSHSVINRAVRRHEEDGLLTRRPGQGRPRCTTAREDRRMVNTAVRQPSLTARELGSQHTEATHQVISTATVRNRLHEAGLHGRRPKKAPKLTPAHRRARRAFVRRYGVWTVRHGWRRVFFSDEVRFALFKADGRKMVWRRAGTRDQHFSDKVAYGGGSVMFWGGIKLGRKSALVHIPPPGLNAERYVAEVLDPHVVPVAEEFGADLLFQHDNAPPHRGIIARDFLDTFGIERLEHPPNSPDLNPIEHLWDEVDRRLRALPVQPNTHEELVAAVLLIWDQVDQETIDILIRSMPRRCAAVRQARGGNTLY